MATLRQRAVGSMTAARVGRSHASDGLRVVRTLDEALWTAFVEQHADASIFHTPEMFRVFVAARHHRPDIWGVVDGSGAIRALMTPVTITTLGGPLRVLTSRAVSFAGPLASPDGVEPFGQLLRSYREQRSRIPVFTEFRHHVDEGELGSVLHHGGFNHEEHLNFLVDLTPSEDELWRKVAPSARRNIRKARRLGVAIEEASDLDGIAAGYEVLRDVYHRIRVPLPDRSLFEAAFRILGPMDRFRVVLARLGARTIGVMTLLRYRHVITYWYTGTLKEHARFGVGDQLVARAIEMGRSMGCSVFDFGGAGRPREPYGVRDFKAKYGGRLVNFGRDLWVPSPSRMRMVTAGYGLVRRYL